VTRLPLTEVYNDLGVVQARRGKKDAVEYFEKAADADPADEDYHFNLGITLARTGETAAAIKQLKDAVSLRPSDNEARNDLETLSAGSSSLSLPRNPERIKRNYDEASFRQLAFAVENAQEETMAHADPQKHAAMYVDMGKQQLSQGFYEEARDHFRKAIALDPANSEAHLGLANAEMALNDLTGARTELTSSLRDKPTADTYIALGQLDLKENNVDAANQDVAEALHLEPGNTAALQLKQQLARLQAKQ
jgi:Flp pilus assembly protein TadD